jgi:arylformamidase
MAVIDISRTLNARIAVWPGDTPFSLVASLERAQGATVNLTTLQLSAHTGSHVDAPHHFADNAPTMEEVELASYWGLAQVVTVAKEEGPLYPGDFPGYVVGRAPRLLVRSAASRLDPTLFPARFVYPSPELADHLGQLGLVLYGTDAPSMDAADSKTLDGHHALHRNGIVILEGLDLSAAADGFYELVALPLRIAGGDGSPVRAALRPVSPPAEN